MRSYVWEPHCCPRRLVRYKTHEHSGFGDSKGCILHDWKDDINLCKDGIIRCKDRIIRCKDSIKTNKQFETTVQGLILWDKIYWTIQPHVPVLFQGFAVVQYFRPTLDKTFLFRNVCVKILKYTSTSFIGILSFKFEYLLESYVWTYWKVHRQYWGLLNSNIIAPIRINIVLMGLLILVRLYLTANIAQLLYYILR